MFEKFYASKDYPDSFWQKQFMEALAPPEGVPGFKVNMYNHVIDAGLAVSSKSKKIKEALQTLDWFYSEEAKQQLLSWVKAIKCISLKIGKRNCVPNIWI